MTDDVAGPTEFFQNADHPLAELYRKRVKQNRDLVILITDSSNDRGTGKTTEALRLAYGMDRTDDGLTNDKVSISPYGLTQSYVDKPHGSGLVLDESEVGVDKYRAGSAVNKSIRELVSTGRVMEKYLVLNAPADHLVDKDLKSLVDVWILVERRGFAKVYRMDWSPHQGHELTHKMGVLTWDAIPKGTDLYKVYQNLSDEKEDILQGNGKDDFIQRSEAQDMVDKAKKEAKKEKRDELIESMVNNGMTQTRAGEIVGLSPSAVSRVVNS